MIRNRLTQIGIDRIIRIAWLDHTASLVLAGNTAEAIRAYLQDELEPSFRSSRSVTRSSLDKTITILVKVWLRVPEELESFRLRGLELLASLPRTDHLPVHWGMLMAVYPFWSGVAEQTGRLLNLQRTVAATSVQRRMLEQYGERETVTRSTQRILRSFHDWGVLGEAGAKGRYQAGLSVSLDQPRLIAWLFEAFLHTRSSQSFPLADIYQTPGLFPFHCSFIPPDQLESKNTSIEIIRHGLNEELLMIRPHQPAQPSITPNGEGF